MMAPLLPPKTDERLLLVIVVLGLLLAAAGAKILRLQEALDAKPAIEDRIVYKRVQGPTRVEVRTITKPGGERVVERIRTVERVEIERQNDHAETPVRERRATRWAQLDFDPARRGAVPVGGRLGMDFMDRFAAGVWVYQPAMAVGATVGVRF